MHGAYLTHNGLGQKRTAVSVAHLERAMYKSGQKRVKRSGSRGTHPFYDTPRVLVAASKHPKVKADVPAKENEGAVFIAQGEDQD